MIRTDTTSSFPEYRTSDRRVNLWGNSVSGVPSSLEYYLC